MSLEQEMKKRGLDKEYYVSRQPRNPLDDFFVVNKVNIHIMKKIEKQIVTLPKTTVTIPTKLRAAIRFLATSINSMFTQHKKVVDIEIFEGFLTKLEIKDSKFNFLKSKQNKRRKKNEIFKRNC